MPVSADFFKQRNGSISVLVVNASVSQPAEGRLPAFRIGRGRYRRFLKEDIDRVLRPAEEIANTDKLLTLTARTDPVLAEVWDNEKDAAYDRI